MMFLWFFILIALFFLLWNREAYHVYGYTPAPVRRDPLEILRERYARGEIDRDEFQRIRDELLH